MSLESRSAITGLQMAEKDLSEMIHRFVNRGGFGLEGIELD